MHKYSLKHCHILRFQMFRNESNLLHENLKTKCAFGQVRHLLRIREDIRPEQAPCEIFENANQCF